ncbi:dipeptidyl aminopeptidase/acylaminoacyl-peptidase, partial [Corchorus olitorius]
MSISKCFLHKARWVQGIYQADIDWMMGIYQHVGHAPYACSVHLETNRYISWNNNDQGEQNAAYAYRKPIEYCSFVFSQQTLHYTDIVPVSPQPKHAVIYLHGGPHNCFMDSYSPVIEKLRDAGLRIIGFNYPGSSGFDYDYRQLIEQDWGGMDLESLIHLRKTVLGDYTDVYLYGVSYGGYLALLAAGKASSLWTKVSACAPFTDLEHLHDT